MTTTIYLTIILFVAGYSVIAGFRRGLMGQFSGLLGMAFGIVGARVLTPEFYCSFKPWLGSITPDNFINFSSQLICAVLIYAFIYLLFSIFAKILNSAVSMLFEGMLNRLAGSFFCITKNLLWVSILYTLILCFNRQSGLLAYAGQDDGNMIGAVMELTPAFLGCGGANDLYHLIQMKDAATISCNFSKQENVIIREFRASGIHPINKERYVKDKRSKGRD